jgi:4-amino-4-deoxy-L-arabinose transferase-like glycosyltransferase
MVRSGNWLRLEFTGEHRLYDTFLNAPLYYWAKALVILALGDTLFAMRALSAGFGAGTVLLLFAFVARAAGVRAGLFAGLALLTNYQFVYLHSARTGVLDAAVAFLVTLAAWLFWRALREQRSFVPHHLCLLALAHVKLPLAFVPLLAELAWFLLEPAARRRLRGWLVSGLWLSPLALAWRAPQALAHWDAFVGVLAKMAGQAASGDPRAAQQDTDVWRRALFYGRALFSGGLPWSLAVPLACAEAFRRGAPALAPRLLLAFAGAVCLFFLAVSKHFPWYVVPAIPFLCGLCGIWLDRLGRRPLATAELAALALLAALSPWLRLPLLDANPFEGTARGDGELAWAGPAGWGAVAAPALAAALGFALLCLWRRRAPLHLREPALAAALAAALCTVGLVRVLAPLRHTHYESSLARLRAEVDAAFAEGRELPDPIVYVKPPGEPGTMKLRYYFGDDFRIVRVGGSAPDAETSEGGVVHLYRRR